MEELGQLLIAVIFILFYALAGSKKRKKSIPPAVRRRDAQAQPTVESAPAQVEDEDYTPDDLGVAGDWEDPGGTPASAEQAVEPKRGLAEELLAMLQEQSQPQTAEAVRLPPVDDEAESLEVLEPLGSGSAEADRQRHVEHIPAESPYAVHDTLPDRPYAIHDSREERPYVVEATTAPQPYAISDSGKRKKHLSKDELRHAFVMREVLGPPKALEE